MDYECISESSIQFASVREMLNNEEIKGIPISFKGMILLGVLNKYGGDVEMAWVRIKAFVSCSIVLEKMLSSGPIGKRAVLYRFKSLTEKPKKQISITISKQHQFSLLKMIHILSSVTNSLFRCTFASLKTHEPNYEHELVLAKRHLQLLESNIQLEDEIQILYENYTQQTEIIEHIDQNIEMVKHQIKAKKLQQMFCVWKKVILSEVRYFWERMKKLRMKTERSGWSSESEWRCVSIQEILNK